MSRRSAVALAVEEQELGGFEVAALSVKRSLSVSRPGLAFLSGSDSVSPALQRHSNYSAW